MDEDSFIRAHRPEWDRLQAVCAEGGAKLTRMSGEGLDDVVRSYLRVSGHLVEARGRYRDRELEEYLNGLVRTAQVAVYGAVSRNQPGALRGFGTRYRDAIRDTGAFILVAAAILVVTTLGSWIWVATSAQAREGIFPEQAQRMIQQSDGGRSAEMEPSPSLETLILVNNVMVSIEVFAFGVTYCVGTIWVLVQNGLMLGSLAGAFAAAGKAAAFWGLILPHGVLELTAICIAAGAGLRIGWSLIDPGDRTRRASLRANAEIAFLVVLGVIPAFAIAATIETWISGTSIPPEIAVALGIVVAGGYVLFLVGWKNLRPRRRVRAFPGP